MTMFRFLTNQGAYGSGFVLVAGGITTASSLTSTTHRYFIANDSVSAGPSIDAKYIYCAFSNKQSAIFAGGGNFSPTSSAQKYSISSNSFTSANSLLASAIDGCGWGNESTGLASRGAAGTAVDKLTWSTESWTAGTALSESKWGHFAIGSSTRAIFCSGGSSYVLGPNQVCIEYLFSNDAVSSTTNIGTARYQAFGHSSMTDGYAVGGSNFTVNYSSTEKFRLADNTWSYVTSLTVARRAPASAGNALSAIISSGSSTNNDAGGVATSEKYKYSGDVVSSGSSIGTSKSGASAICSAPGHL